MQLEIQYSPACLQRYNARLGILSIDYSFLTFLYRDADSIVAFDILAKIFDSENVRSNLTVYIAPGDTGCSK